ncbi:hypothetical protein GC173_13130, partial [bacterium]|nr:hypothetical protein [bacterium]
DADLPAGAVQTGGNDPTTVTVVGGSSVDTADGYQLRGSVTGTVYTDTNGNGSKDDGETGIGGVLVTVTNGLGGSFTDTTEADGTWSVSGVPAGEASVNVNDADLPAGAVQTDGNDPTTVTVVGGSSVSTADGYQLQAASVSGRVWDDEDGNQAIDGTESGLSGIEVTLTYAGTDGVFGNSDDTTATDITESLGGYSFESLVAGNYRVSVAAQAAGESYILTTDSTTIAVTLTESQAATGRNFGFGEPILDKTDGTLLNDVDNNGQFDSGDTVGFVITLTNVSTTTGFTTSIEDVIPPGFSLWEILTGPAGDSSATTSNFVSYKDVNVGAGDTIVIIYTLTPCWDVAVGTSGNTSACIDIGQNSTTELCDAGSISSVEGNHTPGTYPNFCSQTYVSAYHAGNSWPGYNGDGITAANNAMLFNPYQSAVDGENNLYIADHSNHAVRKVDASTGIITTVAGLPNNPGYTGDGGSATAARLRLPADVFVRGYNLYIADKGNSVIRKVDMVDNTITTVAGNGIGGYSGDGGLATAAQLDRPNGVYVDLAGNIYIADTFNFAIRKVDAATGIITTIAGTPTVHGHGADGGVAATEPLEWVMDLAMTSGCDGDTLYFSEQNGYNLIRRIVNGRFETIIGRQGSSALGDCGPAKLAQLRRPVGLAFDTVGNLYIADRDNHKVRKVDTHSGLVTTIAGDGTPGKLGVGNLATSTQLNMPSGVVVGTDNVLYITDTANHRVLRLDLNDPRQPEVPSFPSVTSGALHTIMGVAGSYGYNGDGALADKTQLSYPGRVTFDADGNMIVADFSNHRIRIVYAINSRSRTLAGDGTAGYTGDGGQSEFARINFPTDVATGPGGMIYFTDQVNGVVRAINTQTGLISTLTVNGVTFVQPDGLAISGTTLYVSDRSTGMVTAVDLETNIGETIITGLISPRGLAVDGETGALYIAELGKHRIQRFSATDGLVVVAGDGFARFTGDGGPATAASLFQPMDVEVTPGGDLLIADSRNNAIRKVDLDGFISTVAGTGVAGYNGNDLDPTTAQLNQPWGVTVTSGGIIVISDRLNFIIRTLGTE